MKPLLLVIGMWGFVILVIGCGQVSVEPGSIKDDKQKRLVWPKPPLKPKIRFVKTIAHPGDLDISPSFWSRVGDVLLGKKEEYFIRPTGVAATSQKVFVADPGAQVVWILSLLTGQFQKFGMAGRERLVSPVAVAIGQNDWILLADSFLAKVYVLDAEGELVHTITSTDMRRPAGMAYDSIRDRLYVSDSARHQIWVFTHQGKPLGVLGQRGSGKGEFNFPTYLALDAAGILYVTDSLGFRVQFFSPDGSFLGGFGRHGDSSGDFSMPKGVAVNSQGHIFVVDSLFDSVQIFDRLGRFLLSFGDRGIGPGQFWLPGGLFIDTKDRVYVADSYNQRIQVFEFLEGKGE